MKIKTSIVELETFSVKFQTKQYPNCVHRFSALKIVGSRLNIPCLKYRELLANDLLTEITLLRIVTKVPLDMKEMEIDKSGNLGRQYRKSMV